MRAPSRLAAAGAVLAIVMTACASDGDPVAGDGEPVVIGGFNFPESSILMEIYAQSLEAEQIPVERKPDLGARELVFPELTGGNIDILPEYVGSAIATGFGEEAANTTDEAIAQLTELFADEGVAVLEPSSAQDKNVFVVTSEFSETNGVTAIPDLAGAGDLVLAGGPECEDRQTCFAGLVDTYGLDNLTFQSIQEKAPRIAALENDQAQVILLFSTDPVFADGSLVALEDPQGMTPPENVVPVVAQDALDAYPLIEETLNEVSATLTTEGLSQLNALAAEGQQPEDIAATWLSENGLVE